MRALEKGSSDKRDAEEEERRRSVSVAREGSEEAAASKRIREDSQDAAVRGGSNDELERYTSPSGSGGAVASGSSSSNSRQKEPSTSTGYSKYMTESERRYEEVRRKRLAEKVRKEAKKSHKDRVQEFNDKLERLSEHHDLPRVCTVPDSATCYGERCTDLYRLLFLHIRLDLANIHYIRDTRRKNDMQPEGKHYCKTDTFVTCFMLSLQANMLPLQCEVSQNQANLIVHLKQE